MTKMKDIWHHIYRRPSIVAAISVFSLALIATAGSLTPSSAPGSTFATLGELYDSITSGTWSPSSPLTADQNGSVIEHLIWIEENLGWASSSGNVYNLSSNVGIGDSTPETEFEVVGTASVSELLIGGLPIAADVASNLDYDDFLDAMTLDADTSVSSAGYDFSFLGRVGVGRTDPDAQLDIAGEVPLAAIGSVALSGASQMGVAQGRYVYVADYSSNRLRIYDVSDPTGPSLVGNVVTGTSPVALAIQGRYVYVANYLSNTVQTYDVVNPSTPVSLGTVATGTRPRSIAIQDKYLYVVNETPDTIQVFDISDPSAPLLAGSVATDNTPLTIRIKGQHAFVTNYSNTLETFDLSNPTNPVLIDTVATDTGTYGLSVQGHYVYVANINSNTVQVFDASDPTALVEVDSISTGSTDTRTIDVHGRRAYVISSGTLHVIDVSDPTSVSSVGTTTTASNPIHVDVQGRYAYVVSFGGGELEVFDVGGAYVQQLEAGGADVSDLSVLGEAQIGNGLFVLGGANISRGLQVTESLGLNGNASISGNLGLTGDIIAYTGNSDLGFYQRNSNADFTFYESDGTSVLEIDTNDEDRLFYLQDGMDGTDQGTFAEIDHSFSTVMNGNDTSRTLFLDVTNGNHTGSNNTLVGLDIDAITGDADAAEIGIRVGSGWDLAASFGSNVSVSGNLEVTNIASVSQLYVGGSLFSQGSLSATVEITGDGTALNLLKLSDSSSGGDTVALSVNDGDYQIRLSSASNLFADEYVAFEIASTSGGIRAGAPGRFERIATASVTFAQDVYVSKDIAYVPDSSAGLRIIDVSDPHNPVQLGIIDVSGSEIGVHVAGNYAYVAVGTAGTPGLYIFDVANPSIPVQVGFIAGVNGQNVYVSGRYAYYVDDSGDLKIIDVSDPANANIAGSYDVPGLSSTLSVYATGRYVYLGSNAGLYVVDVSDPTSPTLAGTTAILSAPQDLVVSGRYLYSGESGGLRIYDVADPTSPSAVGYTALTGFGARGVAKAGNYVYAVTGSGYFTVVDVADPTSPVELFAYRITTGSVAEGVFVSGNYAYAAGFGTFSIFDLGGISTPTLLAGDVGATNAEFSDNVDIGNDLYVRGGLSLGTGGLHVQGYSAFASSSEFGDDVLIWGNASASAYFGAGLVDCDTAGTDKLLWDVSTGMFSCGTDQTGGGGVASDSLDFDEFVDGTMTLDGSLTIASAGGTITWQPWFASGLVPSVDDTYSLGTDALRWSDLYVASGSIHIGISGDDGVIAYDTTASGALTFAPDGITTSVWFHDRGTASLSGDLEVEGRMAIGASAEIDYSPQWGPFLDEEYVLSVSENLTSVPSGANVAGIENQLVLSLTTDPGFAYFNGAENYAWFTDANTEDIYLATGAINQTVNDSDQNIDFAYGTWSQVTNEINTGTIGTAYGLYADVTNSAGLITNAYPLYVPGPTGGSAFTNRTGLRIENQTDALVTNAYNIYSVGATGRHVFEGHASVGGNFELTGTVSSNLTPTVHDTYTLGTDTVRWADLYLGPASLHLGATGDEGVIGYNTTGNELIFQPGGSTRVTMEAGGNVGIGTTAPAQVLEVIGEIRVDNTGGGTGSCLRFDGSNLAFSDDCSSYTNFASLGAGSSKWTDGGATTYLTATGDNVGIGTTTAIARLDIEPPSGTTGTLFRVASSSNERFRITSDGNIGIGDSTPTVRLDSKGDTYLVDGNVGIGVNDNAWGGGRPATAPALLSVRAGQFTTASTRVFDVGQYSGNNDFVIYAGGTASVSGGDWEFGTGADIVFPSQSSFTTPNIQAEFNRNIGIGFNTYTDTITLHDDNGYAQFTFRPDLNRFCINTQVNNFNCTTDTRFYVEGTGSQNIVEFASASNTVHFRVNATGTFDAGTNGGTGAPQQLTAYNSIGAFNNVTQHATGLDDGATTYSISNGEDLRIDGSLELYNGVLFADKGIYTESGSAASPSYSFFSGSNAYDADTGMYRIGTDNLGFSTGGGQRLEIDATGNIAIGTTISTGGRLAIKGGNVGIGTTSTDALFDIYAETGDNKQIVSISSASGVELFAIEKDNHINMVGTNAGNVGIGLTGNPQAILTVNEFDNTANGHLMFLLEHNSGSDLVSFFDNGASFSYPIEYNVGANNQWAVGPYTRGAPTGGQSARMDLSELSFTGQFPSMTMNAYYDNTDFVYTTTETAFRFYHDQTANRLTIDAAPSGTAGTNPTWANALNIDTAGNVGVADGYLQVSGSTFVGYNRYGAGTTSNGLAGQSDLFITDDLEVNGVLYADGGIDLNGSSIIDGGSFTGGSISVSGGGGFGASVSANEFLASDGGAADASFTFSSDETTGMFKGFGGVAFTVSGTEKGHFDSAGLDVAGVIDAVGGFSDAGTLGIDIGCAGTDALNGISVSGGLVTGGSCSVNASDYAENFYSTDAGLESGDIVVASQEGMLDLGETTDNHFDFQAVERSESSYQGTVLGIYSTKPGKLIGPTGTPEHPVVPVALAGRVPVKVNEQNGPISVGDMIAASDEPGVGMRATQAGTVVGMALTEPYASGSQEYVVAFINPQFWMPTYDLGDLEELASGSETFGDGSALSVLFGQFVDYLRDIVLTVRTLIVTDELCVGNTCVSEDQLIELLESGDVEPLIMTPAPTPTPDPIEDEEVVEEDSGAEEDVDETVDESEEDEEVTNEDSGSDDPEEEETVDDEPAGDEIAEETAESVE